MPREDTLLDRLRSLGRSDAGGRYDASARENVDQLMESVRRNLTRLLNARAEMSQAAPDYGLPALADVTSASSDYVQRMQDAIRSTIDKYEPRLRAIRVSLMEDAGDAHTLAFRVDATLRAETGDHRVWYQTQFAASGRFDVTG